MSEKIWSVTVEHDGKRILTIGHNSLSGKSDLTEDDEEAIRTAAEHLLSFVGQRKEARLPILEGKRCEKCQSLMYHTRLGGYRCPRGCQ